VSADPRWIGRLEVLYGALLRLYPRRFRAQWEQPMRQAFRDRCREIDRNQRRPATLLAELLPDLAFGAAREHIHDQGGETMFKRNLMFALLILLAAMLTMHDRLGAAGLAAADWWKAQRAHAHAQAERAYWTRLAQAMAPASEPRDHTIAAIAWKQAGEGSVVLPGDADAMARAQQAFDAAIAAGDPVALWFAAIDCPVGHCDASAALAKLQRLDTGNAAVAMLALDRATALGDAMAQARALRQVADASDFHDYSADLMVSLLEVDRKVSPPSHMDADSLVAGMAIAWAFPDPRPFTKACERASGDAQACLAAARVLAEGDSFLSRVVGLKVWNRFAEPGEESRVVRERIRDFHWLISNQDPVPDGSARSRWRASWLDDGSEIKVMEDSMVARGIPLHAPVDFQVDAIYFDPNR